ncbi:family 43 glycosylhydrolase [Paenibacillus sp. Leaf72]|uniref:family 43 glycosylhydrolase n=1 Tax=Paenibacillus sp. Leaf72 TaxID=1736234 RepID=UPI000AE9006A
MFRKSFALLVAFTLWLNVLPSTFIFAQQEEAAFQNPLLWADVPDPDVIRVGDVYYMSSTTMHMNPGVPIMKSTDLVHWEIVNYVYDILADNDEQTFRNGKSDYSKGSWASSLRFYNGSYYVAFSSYSTGKTYIYQTADIEKGPWTRSELDGVFHDMSLLFDDDGRVYMVYGGGDIKIIELTADATAIKVGGLNKILIPDASLVASTIENVGLPAEGSHIQKINGYYYVFNIAWPKNSPRVQIVHRASTIDGTYEGRLALSEGTAQGGIVDTKDGKWYGLLFRDHSAVGRIPFLVPVAWENNWPVFGVNGTIPENIKMPVSGVSANSNFAASDEFYQNAERVGASQFNALGRSSANAAAMQQISGLDAQLSAEEGQELLLNGSFEEGQDPWTAHDQAIVTVTDSVYHSGSNSMHVSSRQATGAGVQQRLASKVKAGGTYKFLAKVKYEGDDSLPARRQFNVAMQDGDWTTIKVMGSAMVNKGEWGTIAGTYTIPADAELHEPIIFIETSWTAEQDPVKDLMNFYVDDVSLIDVTPAEGVDQTNDGEYDYNGSNLALVWQWNHNPDQNHWSLTQRPGYLRLTNGRKSTSIENARNTLTQRTFGPESSGKVAMDISQMKNGDFAGLAAFQKDYGFVGVKMEGNLKSLVMVNASSGTAEELASIPLTQDRVYLKVEFDYRNFTDKANFYYSLNGVEWRAIGNTLQLSYKLDHFMGYRFALFNFATKTTGGYVDFDYFRAADKLTGTDSAATVLQADLGDLPDVIGVQNMELSVPVKMEALPDEGYKSISASFNIPDYLTVTDVAFNADNLTGKGAYTYDDHHLQLHVSGDKVKFANASSDLFATIKLKVDRFVPSDRTVFIRTDYIAVEGGNVVYNVHDAVASIGLKQLDTKALAKIPGYSNPLMSHKLGADPYALVFDGRVYIYMSSDAFEYDSSGNIKDNSFANLNKVHVISSADMVNWTDHGAIPVAGSGGIADWATFSWAPAAAHKQINGKDKFFLYFANGAGGIGVLTADSPLGPWIDPLGEALITGNTPGVPGVVWLFDPAVLVDDDGKGYLYFGGGIPGEPNSTAEQMAHPNTARVIQLGDDLISTVGSAVTIDAPFMFEDSGIHKYNGKYYYSYCSNFAGTHPEGTPPPGEIAYMVSDSPMGPFTYVAPILKNPYTFFGVGGNNHHAIFEFNGEWYVTYHAQTVSKASIGDGKGYRSTHINKVEFYENGRMKEIQADMEGVAQLKTLDPYQRTEAETIAWQAGILTEIFEAPGSQSTNPNLNVTNIHNGDWLAVANVDFGNDGAGSFEANIASVVGGKIEIRIDSPIGEVIGTLDAASTGGEQAWKLIKTDVSSVKGVHNVFLMFKGEGESNLFNMDDWKFTALETEENIPLQSVSISYGAQTLKVNEQLAVNSALDPTDATNPAYQWEASGSISIVGDSNKAAVTIKGLSAGLGTLTLTAVAGGKEKKAVTQITVTGENNGGSNGGSNGGNNGGSSGGGAPAATPGTGSSSIDILINGKVVSAGTGTADVTNKNGKTVTTVVFDEQKLKQLLASLGDNAVITIPVYNGSDIVIGQLNAQMLKGLGEKKAVIEIKTDRAAYTVPVQQIERNVIIGQLGAMINLQDTTMQFEIAEASEEMAKVVENAAAREGFNLVIPPIDFKISLINKDSVIHLTKFNAYVQRTITLPEGIHPDQITTGIVIEPDGIVRHVPTKIVQVDGKYYALLNSLSNSTYSIIYHPVMFKDVANHWAKDAVNDMGSRMVINGIGQNLFNPSAAITRAEFAAIIVRGLGLELESGTPPYSDILAKDWYSSAVMTAQAYGLIQGFEDGTFRPKEKITREQAMTILAKAMVMTGQKAKLSSQAASELLKPYTDASEVADWAKSGIADSIQAGIVTGRNEAILAPKAQVTRAEVAKMVQLLLQKSDLI